MSYNPVWALIGTVSASYWDADVGLVAEKRLPLHATVLAFFVEVEIGDD